MIELTKRARGGYPVSLNEVEISSIEDKNDGVDYFTLVTMKNGTSFQVREDISNIKKKIEELYNDDEKIPISSGKNSKACVSSNTIG